MSRELLKRALEVIDQAEIYAENEDKAFALCQAIEAELAKPGPEPVAWIDRLNFELLPDPNWRITCYVSNKLNNKMNVPLYAESVDQSARIAALKHELQQADEDYVSVEEAYLQCQKDLYDETEKLSTIQSKLKPLTDEELDALRRSQNNLKFATLREFRVIARAVEKQHGITS